MGVGRYERRGVSIAPDQKRILRDHGEEGGLTVLLTDELPAKRTEWTHYWGYGWTPDGKHILAWGREGNGMLIDPTTNKVVTSFANASGEMYTASWSSDGELLAAVGHKTPLIHVWNRDGSQKFRLDTEGAIVRALAISPNKKWLAAGYEGQKSVRLWDLTSGEAGATLAPNRDDVQQIVWLDDKRLAALAGGPQVKVWNVVSLEADEPIDRVWTLVPRAHDPGNPWLLISHNPGKLGTLDEKNSMALEGAVGAAAPRGDRQFTADNGEEVSALCNDEIIRTWDSKTGELKRLIVLLSNDQAISFDPSGKVLAQTPGAEKELLYVVEQPNGSLKLHTPKEFRATLKIQ